MRNGFSLIELAIYLVLVSVFISLLMIFFYPLNGEIMFKGEVESAQHLLRYARQISLMKNVKTIVFFEKSRIRLVVSGQEKEERPLRVSHVKYKRKFAFSNGIPYLCGKVLLSFKREKVVLTLHPVTGMLTVDWE